MVAASWNMSSGMDVRRKIEACASRLRSCSSNRTRDFVKEVATRREKMKGLMREHPTEEVIGEIRMLDMEIDELEGREEMYW